MARKDQERKQPQQARAQETVRAILEATVQILDREGLDAATTTRIAEVAGVSIGSLYQYFSHRDAILSALQDREFERTLHLMERVLADANLDEEPLETVRAVLRGLADLYTASPGLHRVLATYGERWWRLWNLFLAWSWRIGAQGTSACYQVVAHKNLDAFDRTFTVRRAAPAPARSVARDEAAQ